LKISYRNIAEFLGIISIVGSLIFVGIQLMLDRRVALGSQYHERMVLGHEFYMRRAENEEWVRSQAQQWEDGYTPTYWNSDIENYIEERNITMEDAVRNVNLYLTTLIRLNNNYYQYSVGLLEGEIIEGNRTGLRQQMSTNPINHGVATSFSIGEEGFLEIIAEVALELDSEL